jgi:hypothetical protein
LPDDHFDQPVTFGLSRSASLLHIEALVWCNRLLTDGHVPTAMLRRITTSDDPVADAAELVSAGVWGHNGDGWKIDWTHQPSRADVEHQQRLKAERQRRWLDSKKASRGNGRVDASSDASRDASSDASGDDSPPSPAQPRPGKAGSGAGPGHGIGSAAHAADRPGPTNAAKKNWRRVSGDREVYEYDMTPVAGGY